MKIIFMGTPDYASEILDTLLKTDFIDVEAVYTQPDKPVGRKKILTPPQVKVLAEENGIRVYQPTTLRDEEVISELKTIKCDYIVVAAYGQILPKAILEYAPCINLHASILPQYRGASPIQQSILNGDEKTGVTAMLMEEGLDTGDILKISEITIPKDEMVSTLFERLTKVASELTVDVLENFKNYTPVKQDESKATLCKKISKKDGLVEFDDALNIYNKYRAFTPWPTVYLESGLKLKEMKLQQEDGNFEMGKILHVEKDGVVVGCEKGSLKITKVQPNSKKEMDVLSYINGKRLGVEDFLS